jgi:hypothetical protein
VTRALDNLALVAIALRDHVTAPSGDVLARLLRASYRIASPTKDLSALVEERRREVSELWAFLVADMQYRLPICGGVLVVPTLSAFVALEAVARGAVAIVVTGAVSEGAREVVEVAQLPTIAGIPNLLASVQSGDLLEVDGACGTLRSRR